MVAVVKEKHDFSADLVLETASRGNFSEQESLRKKSARLLAETNNRMIHGSEGASYSCGGFRAAKQDLLKNWRENQYGRASDEVIPEVTDVRRREHDENQHLGKERRKKNRRSRHSTNEESCQE